jgi:1-acyl-sn-glycerol-3-phosphate acyltransferase
MAARPGEVLRSLVFYAVFYGGTVFYILTAFVAIVFGKDAFRRVADGWTAFHRGCVRLVLGIKVEVQGNIPQGDALVALKHESFFEAIDLSHLLRFPAIFAKAELLRIPLWGWLASAYGVIPVERSQGAKALRAMLAAAKASQAEGRLLAIFPEGTRVPHGARAPLQSGFAAVYKLLGQPVVPIAVDSGPLYHRWWKRKGTITIRVGEPIPPGLPRREIEARVKQAINVLND